MKSPALLSMRSAVVVLGALLVALVPLVVHAEEKAPEAVFREGATALARGEYALAIDTFEALADQGYVHPDASYDRGLAYVMRYRQKADRGGDLGRAAAAFEETLLLRPSDHDAEAALDLVRAEVTRRRARHSKDAIDVRPTLDRMLVGLASEGTWGIFALVSSLLLSVGLILRPRTGRAHIAGSILVPIAAFALLVFIPLTWGAHALRQSTKPGVVIATETHLVDEQGRAMPNEAVPEAASVEVGERRGGLLHVRWGATEGWAPAADVRTLARP